MDLLLNRKLTKRNTMFGIENIFFNFRTRKWHCVQNILVTLLSVRLTAVPWICCATAF